ncbi:MAG: UTRA domain-containing protein, partial [Gammaproteobacteria bacterium]
LGSKPVITAASEAGFDFVKVEQTISATVANEEAAAAMNTPLGSPLLRVSGLFIAADGTAIMRKDGFFHPDSFEYRMTLQNSAGKKNGKPD